MLAIGFKVIKDDHISHSDCKLISGVVNYAHEITCYSL